MMNRRLGKTNTARRERGKIECICTVLFIAFFVALMGIWPQTVQAQPACIITQITNTTVDDSLVPSINADGTRIAFYSNRDGNNEVFLFDATRTNNPTQITHTTAGIANLNPSINADGTRIAFVSNSRRNSEIFLFDARTGIRRITNTPPGTFTSINANGTRIAFLSGSEIFLWDERTGIRPITTTPAGISNVQPSINADAHRLCVQS